jgi:hypothetical protein
VLLEISREGVYLGRIEGAADSLTSPLNLLWMNSTSSPYGRASASRPPAEETAANKTSAVARVSWLGETTGWAPDNVA